MIYSQPYIYFSVQYTDTSDGELLQKVQRFDLSTYSVEDFPDYQFVPVDAVTWDASQSYLAIEIHNFGTMIYDCNDTTVYYEVNDLFGVAINELLYSPQRNKLYIFSEDWRRDSPITLSVLDLNTRQIISEIGVTAYGGANSLTYPKRNAFFSSESNYIYFYSIDTLTRDDQVWKYSLDNNQIINKKNLSEIGQSGADGYSLFYGKAGKGIVESYIRSSKTQIYNIYNFETSNKSDDIIFNGWAYPYFTNDGKYLVVTAEKDTPNVSYLDGSIRIFDTENSQLLKTYSFPPGGNIYTFDNYPNNLYYAIDIEKPTRQIYVLKMDSIFNELDLESLEPDTVNINSPTLALTMKGIGFDSVSTVYFNGQEKLTTFISDSIITAEIPSSDITAAGSFPVWVTDRYSISDTLQFNVTQASNPNLVVNLKNSLGNQIPASNVKYYEGSWKDAVDNGDGTFTVITTRQTVSIRVFYEYASQQADNVPAQNNAYTFTTVNAAVQLKNSLGNLIDVGTVQYYAGAWRSFGTTSNGVAYKELLPINYSFRMTYEYGSIDKQQNLSINPTVVFQTVNAAVQLKNSLGNLIDVGIVQYYAGAWRSFGTTQNGVANKELLPINYSFRMSYEYGSIDKQQNLSVDPTVVFQTVNAAVQLKNSLGNFIDVGTVQYYAGAWRSFGTTSNGVAYKELLPINYSFRMTYEFVSKDKQQNLSTNPVVDFTTVLCTVKVSKTSNNQPINNATVKYYAGAWRNLGTTNADGISTKELLPANLSFRATYGNVSQDKQQDIGTNSLVEIQLNVP